MTEDCENCGGEGQRVGIRGDEEGEVINCTICGGTGKRKVI